METVKYSIEEMYQINALVFGIKDVIKGFINEIDPNLKESSKRKVYKAGETIRQILVQIDEQRKKIQEYSEDGKSEEELETIKIEKLKELFSSSEEIQIEKPLFSLVENVSLSGNYQFLYEKIFKD